MKKYRGVRQRQWGSWVAEIRHSISKTRIWLGTFETAKEAAMAHDEAARLMEGSAAKLNFPSKSATWSNKLSPAVRAKLMRCRCMATLMHGAQQLPPRPNTNINNTTNIHYPVHTSPGAIISLASIRPTAPPPSYRAASASATTTTTLICLRLQESSPNDAPPRHVHTTTSASPKSFGAALSGRPRHAHITPVELSGRSRHAHNTHTENGALSGRPRHAYITPIENAAPSGRPRHTHITPTENINKMKPPLNAASNEDLHYILQYHQSNSSSLSSPSPSPSSSSSSSTSLAAVSAYNDLLNQKPQLPALMDYSQICANYPNYNTIHTNHTSINTNHTTNCTNSTNYTSNINANDATFQAVADPLNALSAAALLYLDGLVNSNDTFDGDEPSPFSLYDLSDTQTYWNSISDSSSASCSDPNFLNHYNYSTL